MASNLPRFPRRRDRDGLYDAICPRCFATVARSQPEREMAKLEQAHVCNSAFLAERGLFARRFEGSSELET
jgi:hypothetical protein